MTFSNYSTQLSCIQNQVHAQPSDIILSPQNLGAGEKVLKTFYEYAAFPTTIQLLVYPNYVENVQAIFGQTGCDMTHFYASIIFGVLFLENHNENIIFLSVRYFNSYDQTNKHIQIWQTSKRKITSRSSQVLVPKCHGNKSIHWRVFVFPHNLFYPFRQPEKLWEIRQHKILPLPSNVSISVRPCTQLFIGNTSPIGSQFKRISHYILGHICKINWFSERASNIIYKTRFPLWIQISTHALLLPLFS